MGGMKKKGEVQEYVSEQTVLVLFLYQGFLLFKGGIFFTRRLPGLAASEFVRLE